jgi:hypothetical protein
MLVSILMNVIVAGNGEKVKFGDKLGEEVRSEK